MREIDELRPPTAGRLLTLWREVRKTSDDPLERTVLCNARIAAESCFCRGEPVFADEQEVLAALTGRQLEGLLRRVAEGTPAPAGAGNPAFDESRFAALRKE